MVNEIPKHTGIMETPFFIHRLFSLKLEALSMASSRRYLSLQMFQDDLTSSAA